VLPIPGGGQLPGNFIISFGGGWPGMGDQAGSGQAEELRKLLEQVKQEDEFLFNKQKEDYESQLDECKKKFEFDLRD